MHALLFPVTFSKVWHKDACVLNVSAISHEVKIQLLTESSRRMCHHYFQMVGYRKWKNEVPFFLEQTHSMINCLSDGRKPVFFFPFRAGCFIIVHVVVFFLRNTLTLDLVRQRLWSYFTQSNEKCVFGEYYPFVVKTINIKVKKKSNTHNNVNQDRERVSSEYIKTFWRCSVTHISLHQFLFYIYT